MFTHAKNNPARLDHPDGWGRSHQTTAPRLGAWVLAVAVVALLAVALHALYN